MMRALEAAASVTSDSVRPPTPEETTLTATSPVDRRVQRIAQRLDAALHVRLDQQLHQIRPCSRPCVENTSCMFGALLRELDVAGLRLAVHRHFARLALALDHQQLIARVRRARKAQHHHRNGRARRFDRLAGLVEQRPHAAEFLADQQRIAELQRAAQHQHGGDRAAALLEAGLDHVAGRETGGRRLQLEHLGLQQDAVEQLIDALARCAPRPARRCSRRPTPRESRRAW